MADDQTPPAAIKCLTSLASDVGFLCLLFLVLLLVGMRSCHNLGEIAQTLKRLEKRDGAWKFYDFDNPGPVRRDDND